MRTPLGYARRITVWDAALRIGGITGFLAWARWDRVIPFAWWKITVLAWVPLLVVAVVPFFGVACDLVVLLARIMRRRSATPRSVHFE